MEGTGHPKDERIEKKIKAPYTWNQNVRCLRCVVSQSFGVNAKIVQNCFFSRPNNVLTPNKSTGFINVYVPTTNVDSDRHRPGRNIPYSVFFLKADKTIRVSWHMTAVYSRLSTRRLTCHVYPLRTRLISIPATFRGRKTLREDFPDRREQQNIVTH